MKLPAAKVRLTIGIVMKRMKVVAGCEFEFPDDFAIAPDRDGTPSLKIGSKIFIPAVHWMEEAVFLDGSLHGRY